MAHHVAELIAAAETDAGDARGPAARSRAAEEILRLWSHRTTMPRPYPFENFDRIFAALDRLEDPRASSRLGRYFGNDAPTDAQLVVVPLLQMAARVDDEVSDVVAGLIAEAVLDAEDADARWVSIALEIGEQESARALRRLLSVTRRQSWAAQQSAADDEAEESWPAERAADQPPGDKNNKEFTSEGRDAGKSGRDDSDEDLDSARRKAIVEAIDLATATLSRLRSVVVESLESGDA